MLTLRHLPQHLLDDESANSLVELAFMLPVVLMLALGGLEVGNLALSHLRINQVAVTTADNAARVLTKMDESDVDEIFAGAAVVGKHVDLATHGNVILSSVEDNGLTGTQNGQRIGWQRCFGGRPRPPKHGKPNDGRERDRRNGIGPPGRQIKAAPGTALMYVEVTYAYQPIAFRDWIGTPEIDHEVAYAVRERTDFSMSNTRGRRAGRANCDG